jgi:hypothetical protein
MSRPVVVSDAGPLIALAGCGQSANSNPSVPPWSECRTTATASRRLSSNLCLRQCPLTATIRQQAGSTKTKTRRGFSPVGVKLSAVGQSLATWRASVGAGQLGVTLQPVGPARCHQCGPVIGRMAPLEHALEHRVRITLAARRSQSVFIIDPCKDDDPGLGVESKK